jgi:hypothetical protein
MTNKSDPLLPSAKEVMQQIALAEAEEAEKQARMMAEAQAEKKALIDELSKPSGLSEEEAIRRAMAIIERGMKNGRLRVRSFAFPTSCARTRAAPSISRSRAGKGHSPASRKEMYQFWHKHLRPRGYKLKHRSWIFPAVCRVTSA